MSSVRGFEFADPLYVFCTDDGTPTGAKEMNGDYSLAQAAFWHSPPPGSMCEIHTVTVHIGDSGNLAAEKYGNMTALTNGAQIVLASGNNLANAIADLTSGTPIRKNADWARYGANLTLSDFGAGDNFLSIEYRLAAPIILDSKHGDAFGILLNDDMSGLVDHTMFLSGYVYKA